jgi:DNA-binding MarR family transcriptional regulator
MSCPSPLEPPHVRRREAIRASLSRKELAAARQRSTLARLLGLAENDVLAVQNLAHARQLSITQLGDLLGLSSGGATALAQRLERAGHITRSPHPTDRRSTLLRLTPTIAARTGRLTAPQVNDLDNLIDALSDEHAAVVERFLGEVAQIAERHADQLAQAQAPRARADVVPSLWA